MRIRAAADRTGGTEPVRTAGFALVRVAILSRSAEQREPAIACGGTQLDTLTVLGAAAGAGCTRVMLASPRRAVVRARAVSTDQTLLTGLAVVVANEPNARAVGIRLARRDAAALLANLSGVAICFARATVHGLAGVFEAALRCVTIRVGGATDALPRRRITDGVGDARAVLIG